MSIKHLRAIFLAVTLLMVQTGHGQISTELKVGVVFTSGAVSAGGPASTQFAGIKLFWDETFENSGISPPILQLYDGPDVGQIGSTHEYLASLPTKNPSLREWRDANNVDLVLLVVPSISNITSEACGYVIDVPDALPDTLDVIINSASWLSVFADSDNRYVGVVTNNMCAVTAAAIATHESGHLFLAEHEICYASHPNNCIGTDQSTDKPAPYNHGFANGGQVTIMHTPIGSPQKVFSGKDNLFPVVIASAGNASSSDNKRLFVERTFPYTALFRPKNFSLVPPPSPPSCQWEYVGCAGGSKQFLVSWSGGGAGPGDIVEYVAEKSINGATWFPAYSGNVGCVPQIVSAQILYRIFGISQSGGHTNYCQVVINGGQCNSNQQRF